MKQVAHKQKTVRAPKLANKKTESHSTSAPKRVSKRNIIALAQLYNSPTASHVAREELLEEARRALTKYDLAEVDQEIAAQELARTMHMLVEQQGHPITPEHKADLERRVLEWCGVCGRPDESETMVRKSSNGARK